MSAALALGTTAIATGAVSLSAVAGDSDTPAATPKKAGIVAWRDISTGCRWAVTDAGVQPIVGQDGRQICGRE